MYVRCSRTVRTPWPGGDLGLTDRLLRRGGSGSNHELRGSRCCQVQPTETPYCTVRPSSLHAAGVAGRWPVAAGASVSKTARRDPERLSGSLWSTSLWQGFSTGSCCVHICTAQYVHIQLSYVQDSTVQSKKPSEPGTDGDRFSLTVRHSITSSLFLMSHRGQR